MDKRRFFLRFSDYFRPSGRISRLQYLIYSLIYTVIYFGTLQFPMTNQPVADLFDRYGIAAYAVYVLISLGIVYLGYCLNARRLHDISWPATVALIPLIDLPFAIGIEFAAYFTEVPQRIIEITGVMETVCRVAAAVIGLWALLKRGDRGPNKYGPDPLQLPQPDTSVF